MYTEQLELPPPFSEEELDALWFFGLGYYYQHSFWVNERDVCERLEASIRYPLTKEKIYAAIAKKVSASLIEYAGKPLAYVDEEWRKCEHFASALYHLCSSRK